jgi:hypothetical protein
MASSVDLQSHLAIWTSVEPGVSITVYSLAALRPMFPSIFGGSGIFSTSHHMADPRANSANRCWPALRSQGKDTRGHSVDIDSFTAANKKGVTTTVVGATGRLGIAAVAEVMRLLRWLIVRCSLQVGRLGMAWWVRGGILAWGY